MAYLPTWMVDFYGKCRQIYHTWILWGYQQDIPVPHVGFFCRGPSFPPNGIRPWSKAWQSLEDLQSSVGLPRPRSPMDFRSRKKRKGLNPVIYGCFQKKGYPENGWWKSWKALLKWMIWGYHHFRKHPYQQIDCLLLPYILWQRT